MEGKKAAASAAARKAGGSSSSSSSSSSALPSELLNRKAASATAGLFDSVFSTPISSSQVVSRTSACSITIGSPSVEGHAKQPVNSETAAAATARGPFWLEDPNKELCILSKDPSLFSMNDKAATFSLCSSIYYGGQDICVQARPPESTKNYKNDAEEDIGDFAHRGDWWQGSLYY